MSQPCRAVCLFGVALSVLFAIIPLNAAGGGLQGYFNYRQVSVSNNQVVLTVDVAILNRTGGDLQNAIISVRNSFDPRTTLASFPAISILAGKMTDLSQVLNVPQSEFQQWQRGARPMFFISYTDVSGTTVQQPLNLFRRPLKEGN
ncbi:MAG: hypothetical protein JO187_05765 [Acidobacteria bacterium]|nr:hypothetical protein [Acidobacteriota bacterium]